MEKGLKLIADFPQEHPELKSALASSEVTSWVLDKLSHFREAPPVAPTCHWFISENFYRLPAGIRCFYYDPLSLLSQGRGAMDASKSRGVLAFKGTEPLIEDFEYLIDDLVSQSKSEGGFLEQRRLAEHFALMEQKVPGAYTFAEAHKESSIALTVQTRHLAVYGFLAPLPVPLFLHRLPKSVDKRVASLLKTRLSRQAFDRLLGQLDHGLATYTYFYPFPPVRVSQLPSAPIHHKAVLLPGLDGEKTVHNWAACVARLFHLGFLPTTLASIGMGNCLREQNAVVDGGFVDLDSITPASNIPEDSTLYDSLHFTMASLTRTVYSFLAKDRGYGDLPSDYGLFLVGEYVQDLVKRYLQSERRSGTLIDPRIDAYFSNIGSFEALVEKLRAYYPGPGAWSSYESQAPLPQMLQALFHKTGSAKKTKARE